MSASCLAKTCCSISAAPGSPSAFAFRAQNNALLSGGLTYWEAANACSALLCAWAYAGPAGLDGVRLGTLVGAAAAPPAKAAFPAGDPSAGGCVSVVAG